MYEEVVKKVLDIDHAGVGLSTYLIQVLLELEFVRAKEPKKSPKLIEYLGWYLFCVREVIVL